jgi:hypothetical protein
MSGLLAALTAWVLLTITERPAQYDEQVLKLHCEMVQVWEQTGGEFGWPDYNDTAALCSQEEQP